jgi:hypothetical protein
MKKLLALLFSILISFNSYGDIVLYCQEELKTGFISNNQKWSIVKFDLERHTIKFSNNYSELMGFTHQNWNCLDSYDTKEYNSIVCIAPYQNGKSFAYDKNTKRFILVGGTTDGYIDKSSDTNAMSAGTCKEF